MMAISTTTLGLLTTAALLSVFRLPSLIKEKPREVSSGEFHKRFGSNLYTSPTRGPLDRIVNRIFRRPYLADVPSTLYRRPYNQRWVPLPRANPVMFTAESNPALSYNFGYPISFDRKTTRNGFSGTIRPSLRNYFANYGKLSTNSGRSPIKNEPYSHDLEGDDTVDVHHYYHYDDIHPDAEESFDIESTFGEEGANTNEELKGHPFDRDKRPTDLFKPDQSKSSFSYSQSRQLRKPKLTTTKPEYTTKDCSPKVNYHYHMYFTSQKNDSKNSNKKKLGKYKTTSTTLAPTETIYPYSGDQDQKPSEESDTDYVYQVYTNTNMDSAVYPMIEVPSNIRKDKKKKSHFDSDYYNSVLMSKVFGMGNSAKVMPMENYKTESPIKMNYHNPNGMDAAKAFKKDQNSKLYVTMEAKQKPGIKTSGSGVVRSELVGKNH